MIDWTTVVIQLKHPRISCGQVIKLDKHGQVIRNFPTTERFMGSYESSIAVASNDVDETREFANLLFIDGNASKFLQGHNIVGSDNLNSLILSTVKRIAHHLNFEIDEMAERRIRKGNYIVKRLDITHYYELDNYESTGQFLDAVSKKSKTRSGRAIRNKGTVYFNKHSKLWAIKFYSKFDEITTGGKGHDIDPYFYSTPMLEWCRTKVRAELVLRKRELARIAQRTDQYASEIFAHQLDEDTLIKLFNEYMEKIDMSAQITLAQRQVLELPQKLRGTYLLWKQGEDLKVNVSRPTFYRHRTELMKEFGIDISMPCLDQDDSANNIVPLAKIIEARPVQIPEQFYKLNLIHH